MSASKTSRIRIGLVAICLVTVLAGCGASTSVVRSKATKVTNAAPTTQASDAETSTTEQAPSTTEADRPDSTEPDTTTDGSSDTPVNVKAAFMKGCTSGADETTCECVWDKIKSELSMEVLMEAGSSSSIPADLQRKIVDATMGCMTATSS